MTSGTRSIRAGKLSHPPFPFAFPEKHVFLTATNMPAFFLFLILGGFIRRLLATPVKKRASPFLNTVLREDFSRLFFPFSA
ncbi:MAG: hypothetical protein BAA03_05835 [Caldibacillus debilis]|nr:hypothetical protein [Bacillaceae bacterium]OUM91805.1 MAG: hypothetical protein BAA03_05835 [Caldibacillus debilis]